MGGGGTGPGGGGGVLVLGVAPVPRREMGQETGILHPPGGEQTENITLPILRMRAVKISRNICLSVCPDPEGNDGLKRDGAPNKVGVMTSFYCKIISRNIIPS